MKDFATHALSQLLRLSAYTLAKLVTRRTTTLMLLVVGALLSASGAARAEDWPTPGLDVGHARFSAERSGARFSDGRWMLRGGTRVLASPVVADGFVVSADLEGTVRGLRADDGDLAWQTALRSTVQGTPAIARGRVFVPTVANKVVALRLSDGTQLWTRDVGGMTLSSPTAINGDLVVAAGFPAKTVVRLSGATGEVVWTSPPVMEQFSNTSPAVGAGLVVVGTNGGRYYAFDAATGALRWEHVADGLVHLAAPLIAGGRVYMAGGDQSHRVHAVEAATGAVVAGWPIELPAPAADIAGTSMTQQRAVSSIASVAGLLVLQTRLDDAMDTDADGIPDRFLSRESVVGIDPTTATIGWQRSIARAEVSDPNDVPKFFVCPTPAGYASDGGPALVAAASSLAAAVVVLDAGSGLEQSRVAVAGAALASPVLANGRLITVAGNGTVEGLGSSANHPPSAPILSGYGRPLDATEVTLRWLPAADPDAELASYEIRIDADGEVLETWQQQLFVGRGTTALEITAPLSVGTTYTYAVRARDARGALSSWSTPETFSVVVNPAVTVGGTPATSLRAAIAAALPGDVIMLGAGTYALNQTLHVAAGVSIRGAGAGRTTLDATKLGVGISFDRSAPGQSSGLDGVTVAGADTCVQIADGTTGVSLTHLIIRDCRVEGISVRANGAADIVNATFAGNGTAVRAIGSARVKNSLFTDNSVAAAGDAPTVLVSSYNNLFANQKDYVGVAAGTGDFSSVVTFTDFAARDFRLAGPQRSTDKGDPADDVGDEPAPNGGRINLGAFGGTADAELTAPSTGLGGDPTTPGAGPTSDPHHVVPTPTPKPPSQSPDDDDDGGCSVAPRASAHAGAAWLAIVLLAALAFTRTRAPKPTKRARRR